MNRIFTTAQEAINYCKQLAEGQKHQKQYDFTRRIVIQAGVANTDEVNLPSEGAFESMGYNIEYTTQADGRAPIFLRFRSASDGQGQSNDLLPIASIATPGATIPGLQAIRYGYRQFWHFYPKDDRLSIDWDGRALSEDCIVNITFVGYVYPDANKVY
jgi:hypothetical protein